ncbi:uncharacterized protein GLRG_07748 [Colletotrichum graminicola M1.001]|uniref:Uncharacterized protein n=1 Tax=Colletotrichum graminicola (strain M1.001 / M2 / FGSC 10212) TaxID=645133 RepID=E3QNJ1_COLGM|nr:uncharacterized protein GLRG_07748 [Colletotrichum graminicola M1.001]EFQ32478.1 hypothetical protein GLRG_07748 [Colletotrichum graminicola M1.001]
MKYQTVAFASSALLGLVSGAPQHLRRVSKREVPQEHSHEIFLDITRENLAKNNPKQISDPVFGLLGDAAAAKGAGQVTNLACLQQETADQAFTNAKAANDIRGMSAALVYQAIERNTAGVGKTSAACTDKAVNPEIAALVNKHQDPASDGAAANNKAVTLELAKQLASVGGDPMLALMSGTFAPGDKADTTGKGNSCDDANDPTGCIFTQKKLVLDATPDEITQAVKGITPTITGGTGELKAADVANVADFKVAGGAAAAAPAAAAPAATAPATVATAVTITVPTATPSATPAAGNDNDAGNQKNGASCKAKDNSAAADANNATAGADAAAGAAAPAGTNVTLGLRAPGIYQTILHWHRCDAQDTQCRSQAGLTKREAAGTNVQTFTGTLGGLPPPVIQSTGDRPFSVDGDTFVGKGAALGRSCDVQHNACARAANSGQISGGVSQCDAQDAQCRSQAGLTKREAAAGKFGSCSDPSIAFKSGLADRQGEAAFIANNQKDFAHGSAQKIGIIAGFICQRLQDSCKASAAVVNSCKAAQAAATAATQDATAANVFNSKLIGN